MGAVALERFWTRRSWGEDWMMLVLALVLVMSSLGSQHCGQVCYE
jgi:hypothetical protein